MMGQAAVERIGRNAGMTAWKGWLFLFALLAVPAWAAQAAETPYTDEVAFVDHLNDLPADIAWMQAHDKPMMVFFHASYCGYCQKIDDEFIIPMRLNPKYQGRLIIRRVQIDGDRTHIAADGNREGPEAFADRLDVRGVPYVLFFAPTASASGRSPARRPGSTTTTSSATSISPSVAHPTWGRRHAGSSWTGRGCASYRARGRSRDRLRSTPCHAPRPSPGRALRRPVSGPPRVRSPR